MADSTTKSQLLDDKSRLKGFWRVTALIPSKGVQFVPTCWQPGCWQLQIRRLSKFLTEPRNHELFSSFP